MIIEVIDLCQDNIFAIESQLAYFRASVYKNEMAETIRLKIANLRTVVSLLADDACQEAFSDYDAEVKNYRPLPGECSFSRRVARLLNQLGSALSHCANAHADRARNSMGVHPNSWESTFANSRREILALCLVGSNKWHFFTSL